MSSELETGKPSPIVRARSNARWQEPLPIQRFARGAVTRCAAIITRLASRGLTLVRRDRLGVAISAASIEAVYVRRARIIWRDRVEIVRPHEITDGLRRLLAAVPRSRRPPRVVAAFGPLWAQTKRLRGPSNASVQGAAQVVREHTAAFFHRRAPILIALAHRARDGSLWSCAFDRAAIETLAAVLRERQLVLHAVFPAVALAATDDFACARATALETGGVRLAWRARNRSHRAASCLRAAVVGAALVVVSALLAAFTAPSVRDQSRNAMPARCADGTPDLSADTLGSSEATSAALDDTPAALDDTPAALDDTLAALDDTPTALDDAPALLQLRRDFRDVTRDFSEMALALAVSAPLFGDVAQRF